MKRYLDQLMKMRSQERRMLVGGAFVVFLVLNVWFVYPHFHDWAKGTQRMKKAQGTLQKYQLELGHTNLYAAAIKSLNVEGMAVPAEDQAIHFERTYTDRANENGLVIAGRGPLMTHTNEFFLEQERTITFVPTEEKLVNFLYSLGTSNSMIRVRTMSLRPDPSHQNLSANVTLVASYQKKAQARPAAPAKPPAEASEPKKQAAATNKPGPLIVKRP